MGATDPNPKRAITVESIPSSETLVTTASATVTAGDTRAFIIFTAPYNTQLNLWNFLWNIYVDADDPNNDWFGGPNLTLAQRAKLIVTWNQNWAQSSDRTNMRVNCMKIVNNDTVDHTLYFKFKAYTFAGIAG